MGNVLTHRRFAFLILLLQVAILTIGCGAQRLPGLNLVSTFDPRLGSEEELREELDVYQDTFEVAIINTSDAIAKANTDQAVQRAMLQWKLESISKNRALVNQNQPQAALLDAWGYAARLNLYFNSPDAIRALGPDAARLGAESAEQFEATLAKMATRYVPAERLRAVEENIAAYARRYPITDLLSDQSSATFSLDRENAGVVAGVLSVPLAPFRAVKGLTGNVDALQNLNRTATDFKDIIALLPSETRWQTELFLYDIQRNDMVTSALLGYNQVTSSVERFAAVAETLPQSVQETLVVTFDQLEQRGPALNETLRNTQAITADATMMTADFVDITSNTISILAEATKTSDALTTTIREVQVLMAQLGEEDPNAPEPAGPPAEPLTPQDIKAIVGDVRGTVEELNATLTQLRQIVEEGTLDKAATQVSETIDATVGGTTDQVKELVNFIFVRLVALVAISCVLVAITVIVLRILKGRRRERAAAT